MSSGVANVKYYKDSDNEFRRVMEESYVDAIEKSRNDFIALAQYADFLMTIGDIPGAEKYFTSSLRFIPSEIPPYKIESYAYLFSTYAYYLEAFKKDFTGAIGWYNKALEINPKDPLALGSLAMCLHRVCKSKSKVIEAYTLALSSHNSHGTVLAKYASLLQHSNNDIDGAEFYYKAAVDASPTNEDVLGNYAIYLHQHPPKQLEANDSYKAAIALNGHHSNNVGNYGLYLAEVIKDYGGAEKQYRQSLRCYPNHVNTLYNYAVMCHHHLKKYDEAQALYKKALENNPKHVYSCYNYAVFAEDIRHDLPLAKSLFERAAAGAPEDASVLADYAAFLARATTEYQLSRQFYENALQKSTTSSSPSILFPLASVMLLENSKNVEKVEKMFQNLLVLDTENTVDLSSLASKIAKCINLSVVDIYNRAMGTTEEKHVVNTSLGLYYQHVAGNYQKAEACFKAALTSSAAENPLALRCYAKFLVTIKKDRRNAELLIRKAISNNSTKKDVYNEILSEI